MTLSILANTVILLSVVMPECHILLIVMMSVVTLNVVMSVIMLTCTIQP